MTILDAIVAERMRSSKDFREKNLREEVETKIIQPAYRKVIGKIFDCKVYGGGDGSKKDELMRSKGKAARYPDGFFEVYGLGAPIRAIIENKRSGLYEFNTPKGVAPALAQSISYIYDRRKEDANDKVNVIIVGDSKCFAIVKVGNWIENYLKMKDIDWEHIKPCQIANIYPAIPQMITRDIDNKIIEFQSFGTDTSTETIHKIIKSYANDMPLPVLPITKNNLKYAKQRFECLVLPPDFKGESYMVFFKFAFGDASCRRKVVSKFKLSQGGMEIFKRQYRVGGYAKEEIAEIVMNSDVIFDTEERQRNGNFGTPTPLVVLAKKYIDGVLKKGWENKYLVWDPFCGHQNLTFNLKSRKVVNSCSSQADIDVGILYKNYGTTLERFDFLNDGLNSLPHVVKHALECGKPLLVWSNPPFASACNYGEEAKSGISMTTVHEKMSEFGRCQSNLLAQFIFNITQLKKQFQKANITLAFFANPIFETSQDYAKLRKLFLSEFKYSNGFIVNANNFRGNSKEFGILFSIWKQK